MAKSLSIFQTFRSLLTDSSHVKFGLPRPLLTFSARFIRPLCTGASGGLRWICPNHLRRCWTSFSSIGASGKKKKNAEMRRRQQSPLESSKKKKGRQGLVEPEEAELPLRVVVPPSISNDIPNHIRTPTNQFLEPSHMMQAPYVTQQFGLNSLQGFAGMSPFGQMQEPSHVHLQQPHLQQPPFHSGPQMHEAPPPDIQSLQFLSSNTQLGHQTTDQGQYTIPVWDFL
ncbi:hypothetical protein ACQ4PT_004771 [Festuca glaucescens]